MKTAIFFCLLALACHEALSAGPNLIIGNCTSEDIPENVRAGCNKVTCNKYADGNKIMTAIPCALGQCPVGKNTKWGPADLTKTYPDCCPKKTCE